MDTVKIKCPHIPNSRHNAELYVWPSKIAGLWICPYGFDGGHEHEWNIEELESYPTPQGTTRIEKSYICAVCGKISKDSPEKDRSESIVDMIIMEAMGK